jgi:hypothetical protein
LRIRKNEKLTRPHRRNDFFFVNEQYFFLNAKGTRKSRPGPSRSFPGRCKWPGMSFTFFKKILIMGLGGTCWDLVGLGGACIGTWVHSKIPLDDNGVVA